MLKLYDYLPSGNSYKVRLLLTQLRIPFERVELDIASGETRTPDFLTINPDGCIPVLEFEDGARLSESNAILFYLAEDTPFLPDHGLARAQILQWMFFEQYSHEPNITTSCFYGVHGELTDESHPGLEQKRGLGYAVLEVMEKHLAKRTFFASEQYTIADIALYAYTHVRYEVGFDLNRFEAVKIWLERIRVQPGHIPITQG